MTFLELLKTKELLESIKQQGFKRGAKGTKKNSINEYVFICLSIKLCVSMSICTCVCVSSSVWVHILQFEFN